MNQIFSLLVLKKIIFSSSFLQFCLPPNVLLEHSNWLPSYIAQYTSFVDVFVETFTLIDLKIDASIINIIICLL